MPDLTNEKQGGDLAAIETSIRGAQGAVAQVREQVKIAAARLVVEEAANDGRLSPDSSAQLDYVGDQLDDALEEYVTVVNALYGAEEALRAWRRSMAEVDTTEPEIDQMLRDGTPVLVHGEAGTHRTIEAGAIRALVGHIEDRDNPTNPL